jgi:predicted AAA+ superfamily ATPase
MLKRKIISQLEEWKNNHSYEALLIKGARQVGKTTIVRAADPAATTFDNR